MGGGGRRTYQLKIPMHEDLKFLSDDLERNVTDLFAVHKEIPGDPGPEDFFKSIHQLTTYFRGCPSES